MVAEGLAGLTGSHVATVTATPGMVATNLGRRYHAQTPGSGRAPAAGIQDTRPGRGHTGLCCSASQPDGVSDYDFEDCNPVTPDGPHFQDLALAERLWAVSEALMGDYLS